MKSEKTHSKLLIACIALISVAALLKAGYYKPDFFPIGLTGLNYTGKDIHNGCPYGNDDLEVQWGWDETQNQDYNEKALIEALGVNCLGCEDAQPGYLIDWSGTYTNNYLHKVCMVADSEIFIIPNGFYVDSTRFTNYYLMDSLSSDTPIVTVGGPKQMRTSNLFRTPYRGRCDPDSNYTSPWGDPKFGVECDVGGSSEYGTTTNDGLTYGGDDPWKTMVDDGITNFEAYFADTAHSDHEEYIWGFNLLSEDPAMYRGTGMNPPWDGVWMAVNRVLKDVGASSHQGFRGIDFEDGKDRMVVAKGHIWMFDDPHPSVNIFNYLPDIDVIVEYNHYWNRAIDNYGDQHFLDRLLYGSSHADSMTNWKHPEGYHHTAVYMQRYGNTSGGPSGQERRWMPGLCIESRVDSIVDTFALCRRPCPPEIRAASYLCLSRGAKGILYHPWLNNYTGDTYKPPSNLHIPSDSISSKRTYYNVGLRDEYGYPFGKGGPGSGTHKLNNSYGDTYWHTNNDDYTYYYLDTLVQEIKKITDILIELDWVNGYSLNSTCPEWRSPCPHYYVDDVWGCEYADLGFFNHPYEPVGVEYFMMVNREGIADMTNRNVSVALDAQHWPEEDTLILTDIAKADIPRKLARDGERFIFTEVFKPGEGKLYRVAPANEAPIVLVPSTEGGVR